MIKAVIFDMFETLVSLFEGRTYFSEDIAADLGVEHMTFRKAWHQTEEQRTRGIYTIEQAAEMVLEDLGVYSKEAVKLIANKRLENLQDTFSADLTPSLKMLKKLKERGYRTGLISNCYSDECRMIQNSVLYPYIDVPILSYECGICKPDEQVFSLCCEKLEVDPKQCLFVGDGGSNELFAARAFGMQAIQALYYHHLAFEPHIPCYPLEEFPHLKDRSDLFQFL